MASGNISGTYIPEAEGWYAESPGARWDAALRDRPAQLAQPLIDPGYTARTGSGGHPEGYRDPKAVNWQRAQLTSLAGFLLGAALGGFAGYRLTSQQPKQTMAAAVSAGTLATAWAGAWVGHYVGR